MSPWSKARARINKKFRAWFEDQARLIVGDPVQIANRKRWATALEEVARIRKHALASEEAHGYVDEERVEKELVEAVEGAIPVDRIEPEWLHGIRFGEP